MKAISMVFMCFILISCSDSTDKNTKAIDARLYRIMTNYYENRHFGRSPNVRIGVILKKNSQDTIMIPVKKIAPSFCYSGFTVQYGDKQIYSCPIRVYRRNSVLLPGDSMLVDMDLWGNYLDTLDIHDLKSVRQDRIRIYYRNPKFDDNSNNCDSVHFERPRNVIISYSTSCRIK